MVRWRSLGVSFPKRASTVSAMLSATNCVRFSKSSVRRRFSARTSSPFQSRRREAPAAHHQLDLLGDRIGDDEDGERQDAELVQHGVDAVAADPAALRLLQSDDEPGAVLEALRSLAGESGEAASDYLDLVGYRLLDGFDISGRYALELPDALLRAIRAAVEGEAPEDANLEERIAEKLGTRVGITHAAKGSGKLVIEYRTLEHLDDVLSKLGLAKD